jgi:transcriptional regulator with XRE-family HTH domain
MQRVKLFGGAMKNFSTRLLAFRRERKMTQKQVAEATGMTERFYQSCEYGEYLPGIDNLIALADCFDLSLDELVGRERGGR